ncbi:unnamed protein product [Moneuplotes crassus]|uniref:Uncharacterized protein n=1 Tax=Euplotes crassus TaxID=5936 RepID=A0AAD1U289_EUPCR|nr:unnamed protein product [Moneuplotes crassus]
MYNIAMKSVSRELNIMMKLTKCTTENFIINNQPEDTIVLTSPGEVKNAVNLLIRGLKFFMIFNHHKHTKINWSKVKRLHKEMIKDVKNLEKRISKAESKQELYLFTALKKEAEQIKETIDEENVFNRFTNNYFWSLLEEENRASAPSMLAYDIYRNLEEVDLHQEEFIKKNAEIKKLKKQVKKLKQKISRLQDSNDSSSTESISESDSSASSEEFKSALQEEMARDPECREYVEKMGENKGAKFRLENGLDRKVFGLMDQNSLVDLTYIDLWRVQAISPDEFHTFITKIPEGLQFFDIGFRDSSVKISPYLPSLLLLQPKLKSKICFWYCTITSEEKEQIEETFRDIIVDFWGKEWLLV